jgi:subtilisin-like proprotein convertase family protein
MKTVFATLFTVLVLLSKAQVFSDNIGGAIPDHNISGVKFYLPVTLPQTTIDSTFGLKMIMVDITHPKVQDLIVTLIAPDGTIVELVNAAGGSFGKNFDSTCFSMNATRTALMVIATPQNPFAFRDTFYPRQNIGFVNNGQNPNGTWKLAVSDGIQNDSGSVHSWSLYLGSPAPAPKLIANSLCNIFNASNCACPDSTVQQNCWLLPDIVISKNWFSDSALGFGHYLENPLSISVSNMLANIGFGPLELVGSGQWYCGDSVVGGVQQCPDGSYSKQKVNQRIYIKNSFGFFDYKDTLIGTMGFHAALGHQHLHIDNITENSLRIGGPETDPLLWPILARGEKVSFSIYDHLRCDNTFEACEYKNKIYTSSDFHNAGLGATYGATGFSMQGISVGYADLYEYNLDGQSIHFDSTLCNGDYYIFANFDPLHRIADLNRDNNVVFGKITLTKQRTNCCEAAFQIDTLDWTNRVFRFIDRSKAIPGEWHWTFGDGDSSTAQFPVHQFKTNNNFAVHLKTKTHQGCEADIWQTLQLPQGLGIEKPHTLTSVAIFPNPSQAVFHVALQHEAGQSIDLSVIDIQGKEIYHSAAENNLSDKKYSFDLRIENAGVYILIIKTNDAVKQIKLVKE